MDIRVLHEKALQSTRQFVVRIDADQWQAPTPCPAWSLRQLVNHVVVGNLWVRELGLGATIDEVGDKLDGDLLRDDPITAFVASADAAIAAFAGSDAMDRLWPLSYGSRPGRVYARQRFIDVLIHGWDIGTAIGQYPILPADLVEACAEIIEAHPQLPAQWRFSDVEMPKDADPQTELIALAGRHCR